VVCAEKVPALPLPLIAPYSPQPTGPFRSLDEKRISFSIKNGTNFVFFMKTFPFLPALVLPLISGFSAQAQVAITSFGKNGELTFEDTSPIPYASYRVEWSSDLQSWLRDMQSLKHIASDGILTTVNVPMFYRVVREDLVAPLPSATDDTDYIDGGNIDAAKSALGKHLFYDKVLSGNRNISCATCHHNFAFTADGLSLSLGEGASGLGKLRRPLEVTDPDSVPERVPRNAPHIWNIGALEFSLMFWDGRVAADYDEQTGLFSFTSPAGNDLLATLENAVAVQAMFPVTSGTEMAGQAGENEIADLAGDLPALWEALASRLRAIPEYVSQFQTAFDDVDSAQDITFAHAANAIAAYEMQVGRADNSPFDRYLRGDEGNLNDRELSGLRLFYGKANCASCHSGKFQTDHSFRAIAMPQLGPGKGDGDSGHEDFGRFRVTGLEEDKFRFRVPSLRNIALTAPYGHSGAYDTLEAVVHHHLDPVASYDNYDRSQTVLPSRSDLDALDFLVMDSTDVDVGGKTASDRIKEANELPSVSLTEEEISDLIAFLQALTDPGSVDLRSIAPMTVPSGLPVAD
jgi:cytochrome c peroxidase